MTFNLNSLTIISLLIEVDYLLRKMSKLKLVAQIHLMLSLSELFPYYLYYYPKGKDYLVYQICNHLLLLGNKHYFGNLIFQCNVLNNYY